MTRTSPKYLLPPPRPNRIPIERIGIERRHILGMMAHELEIGKENWLEHGLALGRENGLEHGWEHLLVRSTESGIVTALAKEIGRAMALRKHIRMAHGREMR